VPAYLIFNVDVHDPDGYARYASDAPDTVARFGGRILARAGRMEVLEGDWVPGRLVVIEFPTYDDARGWWDREPEDELRAVRQATSTAQIVLTDGLP
jgi:uncharacterized protein (DUF1330 family)